MTQIKGLPTDLREEFPQRGTGIHMTPTFRPLRELDDWHRRFGFPRSGFLPSATDTMAGDGLSLRELCFDLPLEIADDPGAEEVRVVHLLRLACLDHLDVDLLSFFL